MLLKVCREKSSSSFEIEVERISLFDSSEEEEYIPQNNKIVLREKFHNSTLLSRDHCEVETLGGVKLKIYSSTPELLYCSVVHHFCKNKGLSFPMSGRISFLYFNLEIHPNKMKIEVKFPKDGVNFDILSILVNRKISIEIEYTSSSLIKIYYKSKVISEIFFYWGNESSIVRKINEIIRSLFSRKEKEKISIIRNSSPEEKKNFELLKFIMPIL